MFSQVAAAAVAGKRSACTLALVTGGDALKQSPHADIDVVYLLPEKIKSLQSHGHVVPYTVALTSRLRASNLA